MGTFTSWFLPTSLTQENDRLANKTLAPWTWTPLTPLLIRASQQTRQDISSYTLTVFLNPLIMNLGQEMEPLEETFDQYTEFTWHLADKWILILMVILISIGIIWMVIYMATFQKFTAIIVKGPDIIKFYGYKILARKNMVKFWLFAAD